MGRKRKANHNLPPRLHVKSGRYYHVSSTLPRKWTPLGDDINEARRKWADLESEPIGIEDKTFTVVARRYVRDILPKVARRTQKDYLLYLTPLESVFGSVSIDCIRPADIAEYLRIRGKNSEILANREKALFSTIFNHARTWGFTEKANPCSGVRGFKERPRDRYVSDDEYKAVWKAAHPTLQDAMDLALYTGQRPADVLKIAITDIQSERLAITQNKTGKKLRIAIEGGLEETITRILAKRKANTGPQLLQDASGEPLSYFAFRSRFDKARKLANVKFQFRDLRAKAATDSDDLHQAQKLLGHKSRQMTEDYTRDRIGEFVKPLRKIVEKEA